MRVWEQVFTKSSLALSWLIAVVVAFVSYERRTFMEYNPHADMMIQQVVHEFVFLEHNPGGHAVYPPGFSISFITRVADFVLLFCILYIIVRAAEFISVNLVEYVTGEGLDDSLGFGSPVSQRRSLIYAVLFLFPVSSVIIPSSPSWIVWIYILFSIPYSVSIRFLYTYTHIGTESYPLVVVIYQALVLVATIAVEPAIRGVQERMRRLRTVLTKPG